MSVEIGIDARMLFSSGIGTYLRSLVLEYPSASHPRDWTFTLAGTRNPNYPDFKFKNFNPPIYSLGEQFAYGPVLRSFALWHAPHYNVPFLKPQTPLVTTIHDLIHWVFRGKFFSSFQAAYARTMITKAISNSAKIITVSQKSKQDLVEHFGADEKRISVIYEAAARDFKPADRIDIQAVKERYQLPDSYFFYVGLLKPHKNVWWLVQLFRRLWREKKIRSPLVVLGRKDKSYPIEMRGLAALDREDAVIYLPGIEAGDLPTLYSGAQALVHPSLYEGFGLTLLEAMACGTPVAALRTASIPEVAGDAAFLHEPGDDQSMAETIQKLEGDSALRETFRQKGFIQVKKFSWQKAATETLAVYERALAGGLR